MNCRDEPKLWWLWRSANDAPATTGSTAEPATGATATAAADLAATTATGFDESATKYDVPESAADDQLAEEPGVHATTEDATFCCTTTLSSGKHRGFGSSRIISSLITQFICKRKLSADIICILF